jgi:hypothetical protein
MISLQEPTPGPTMTVVPVPVDTNPIDRLLGITPAGAAVVGLLVLLVLASAMLIAWAVIHSASLPPPAALITSLALLSLFAIAGGIATDTEAAWTIAAAGVGALAASVTSMFQNTRYDPSQTVEKAVAVVQELDRQERKSDHTQTALRPPPPQAPSENPVSGFDDSSEWDQKNR